MTSAYTMSITDTLSDAAQETVSAGHTAYEQAHGIDIQFRRFAILLHDDTGALCGALQAFTAYAEVYVEDLWVAAAIRRRGYGRQLLARLEHEYTGRGYHNINLVTNAFQAPDFYAKCGYSVEFVRVNAHNPLLTKTFFVKYLNEYPKKHSDGVVQSSDPAYPCNSYGVRTRTSSACGPF